MRPNNTNPESLYTLIRLGVGHPAGFTPKTFDWEEIKAFADEQGLSAVVLDGIEMLPEQQRPPKIFLLEWIGETLQGYEYRFDQYRKAISELAYFYNSRGFKMMVLKGYACSIDWPKPEHRPYGDIDIWQFGKHKEADAALAKEKGIEIDSTHHHHTVFYWGEFMVENHYDFVNVHDYKSSKELEFIFKELGKDDTHTIDVYGETVYLPSPNLHALFLIRHLALHFASVSINLRQMIDWGFFVEKHTGEINWSWLCDTLKKYHMMDFFNCINAICVGDLGFSAKIFPNVQFDPSLKDKMVKDILEPEFIAEEPKHFFPRLIYKYQRWQGNAWKQNLCFGESRRTFFWRSLWAHLLKPTSI